MNLRFASICCKHALATTANWRERTWIHIHKSKTQTVGAKDPSPLSQSKGEHLFYEKTTMTPCAGLWLYYSIWYLLNNLKKNMIKRLDSPFWKRSDGRLAIPPCSNCASPRSPAAPAAPLFMCWTCSARVGQSSGLLECLRKFLRTCRFCFIFPQQRKLMGSSAQISSGVCRCGSEEQVPEEGSRRFRRVPVCAGVDSGGRFRRVPVV